MPRTNVDYSKTVIYRICCNDLAITDEYVGSTTDFVKRKYQHKTTCNRKYTGKKNDSRNLKIYVFIRNNGGWDNFSMIEIETFPCQSSNEATARERYWYEQLNCSNMNMVRPMITQEEKDNYGKQVYICECGKTLTESRKKYHSTTANHLSYEWREWIKSEDEIKLK
jgi:hypothetical protein